MVDAQPIPLLGPTLRAEELSQLRREGVRTFGELRSRAEQLAARYGDARAADLDSPPRAARLPGCRCRRAPPPPPPRQAAASSSAVSSSSAAAPRPRAVAAAEEEDLRTFCADLGTVEMLEAAGCKDTVDEMKWRSREKHAAADAAAAAAAGATGAAGGRPERAAAPPAAGEGWACPAHASTRMARKSS